MRILIGLGLAFSLSACSGSSVSSLYPTNWFSQNDETVSSVEPRGGYPESDDLRPVVGQIRNVSTERTPYGVIVHVNAIMPNQDYFDLDLVEVASNDPRELVFELRGWRPQVVGVVGTERQRQVDVATFISQQTVQSIRVIRINGAGNSQTTRP